MSERGHRRSAGLQYAHCTVPCHHSDVRDVNRTNVFEFELAGIPKGTRKQVHNCTPFNPGHKSGPCDTRSVIVAGIYRYMSSVLSTSTTEQLQCKYDCALPKGYIQLERCRREETTVL